MFLPATQPELVADKRNRWTEIGNEYWQSEKKDGIVLEIRHHENGKYRWWLYDEKTGDFDTPVLLDDCDTLAGALSGVYDFLKSHRGIPVGLDDLPTVIRDVECFDSNGTVSLQRGDLDDAMYLSLLKNEAGEELLSDSDHQWIIDLIAAMLVRARPVSNLTPDNVVRLDKAIANLQAIRDLV